MKLNKDTAFFYNIEIIPLISLAELKNPNVPVLVISYVLNPIPNKVGINIKNK